MGQPPPIDRGLASGLVSLRCLAYNSLRCYCRCLCQVLLAKTSGEIGDKVSEITTSLAILITFLALIAFLGLYGYRIGRKTVEDYFAASRTMGSFVTLFTYFATLCSAFTFLGCAGWGYSRGLGWYGPIGVGTALISINFYVFGYRVWLLGKKFGYVSPPELIKDRFGKELQIIYAVVMVIFVLPYLAVQAMGAGYVLEELSQGVIPYVAGAGLITLFMIVLILGGMRSVAWTDTFMGIMMLGCLAIAFGLVVKNVGGLPSVVRRLAAESPEHLSRPGVGEFFSPGVWFGFLLLWVVADPLMPHLWMRMYIPKNVNVIKRMMILFPLVCLVVFFFPVWIGAMGYTVIPGLEGPAVDKILPLLMVKFAPAWLVAIILSGSLAALISTADSQVLALSSILTRDLYVPFINKKATSQHQVTMGRIITIILCVFGFVIALRPVSTLVAITASAFTGIGVLYPATIAALYWKRATKWGAISSILTGEAVAVLLIYGVLPKGFSLGSLPILPSLIVATATLIVVSYLTSPPPEKRIAKFFDLFDSVFKRS